MTQILSYLQFFQYLKTNNGYVTRPTNLYSFSSFFWLKGISSYMPSCSYSFADCLFLFSFFFLGQQRSRMLATLFKDERCQQLPAFSILEKMYLDRIIRRSELEEFASMLLPHQKAVTGDGMKSLSKSFFSFK